MLMRWQDSRELREHHIVVEEIIHYVHTTSKGLRGRILHHVWACVTLANTKAQAS